jgi:uncharacterized protein
VREEKEDARAEEIRATMDALLEGVPDAPEERSHEAQVRHLAAHLLEWHRREDKQAWWTFFRWRDELSEEELLDENQPLAGLVYDGIVGGEARSNIHRFRFPPQDHKVEPDKKAKAFLEGEPERTPTLSVVAVDESAGTLELKAARNRDDEIARVRALVPDPVVATHAQRARLLDVGRALADGPDALAAAFPAADALLRLETPVFDRAVSPLTDPELDSLLDRAVECARTFERGVLPVQGPPGTGKTYAGARMIAELLAKGLRVGLTANSHKVITNLLDEVCVATGEEGVALKAVQACRHESTACTDDRVTVVKGAKQAVDEILGGDGATHLFAGTAWLWANEDLTNQIDVLVVDEAGQFALANAVAVSHVAPRMILLGDPQQLSQPLKGFHPDGLDVSVLEHLMQGRDVIAHDRGLFLGETWRMRPEITAFTSELFYRGELEARAETHAQQLTVAGAPVEPGLQLDLVTHRHNTRSSTEEAARVVELCRHYLGHGQFTDREGTTGPMRASDLRVVAPYNAQVRTIRDALDAAGLAEVPVGTVDKFQGQEAPVAMYSLTSSSAEEAPRGMSFLHALDRLNVATSRAKVVTHLIASPQTLEAECRTPDQLRQLNAFLRYREMARVEASA